MSETILKRFFEYSEKTPDQLFSIDPSGSYTYGEAGRRVRRGVSKLQELGIRQGDRVAVSCTQDSRFLLALIAAEASGAVCVPIEAHMKEERLKGILEDTGAAVLFTGEDALSLRSPRMLAIEELTDLAGDAPMPELPGEEMTAEILYTTGTTGKSKGIEITHANNYALAENICFGCGMREKNVELVPLPLSHSHGLRTCFANIYAGGTVILTDGVSKVKEIYDLIRDYGATAMDLSPTAVNVLLRLSRGRFSDFNDQLDYIEIGTAPLSEGLKGQLKKAFPDVRLYNFYGSTESGRSCVLNFNSDEDKPCCIGYPSKHARFFVVDDAGREFRSSKEHTGLLACEGAMTMKGYFRQEELTKSVLRGGALFTADEGYIDEKGRVFCLGRRDDVVNYRGIKIAPEEIESIAAAFPGITDAALVGKDDARAGQLPVLCYMTNQEDFDEASFSLYLSEKIEKDRLPHELLQCKSIPRTANGKLRRGVLKEQLYGASKQ